ncbi:MAG: hypothetical protein KGH75_02455 [Rhodospirillales bacterium]|nr:hypothetical protein [Rhodospirillales bacterium]
MTDGEEWLMRPVLRQMVDYRAIHDPGLGLEDFARMNEALDVEADNRERVELMTRS